MTTVGDRIREFGEEKFGKRGMAKFAEALEMKPQALSAYLSNSRTPGNKLQQKLRELGANIEYIMTGIKQEEMSFNQHIGSITQHGSGIAGINAKNISVDEQAWKYLKETEALKAELKTKDKLIENQEKYIRKLEEEIEDLKEYKRIVKEIELREKGAHPNL